MFRSKHSGWTWEGKRTPFGGGGGPSMSVNPGMPRPGGKGSANPVVPPEVAKYAPKNINEIASQVGNVIANQPQQPAPMAQQPAPMPQQAAPVSPFVQQQRQQMQPQMGIGYQQPGLQSMLARILGMGGGGYGMPPQMMQQRMPQQGFGMPQQGGMPAYGQYGMGQNPLGFRPDMSRVYQNLSNVKPSIQRQNEDAQAARIADLEAQLARYNTPSGE